MRRIFISFILLLLLSGISVGQSVKNLPKDPRIKTGKMANGLSYYLVKNDNIKGRADFYLVQNVGYDYETSSQRGMNSAIGRMSFRGTRNFPEYTILSYIRDLGLESGKDFGVTVNPNESIYKLTSVPVGRSGAVIDSTLLILFNWASSTLFDEEDVNKEIVASKNFYAAKMDTYGRAYLRHKANILPDFSSDYSNDSLMVSNIERFTSKSLRSYYFEWYRPERQSIVIVGDIDPASVEGRIKALFQATPTYLNKVSHADRDISDSDSLRVSIVYDREQSLCDMRLYFQSSPLPSSLRGTAVPYIYDYMNGMMINILKNRLRLLSEQEGLGVVDVDVSYAPFLDLRTKDALDVYVKALPTHLDTALSAVTRELYRIKKYGVTKDEFLGARDNYYKQLNYRYDWRIVTTNDSFYEKCVNNYLHGYSLASVEMNKEYMDLVKNEIDQNQFNLFISSYLRDGDNSFIALTLPAHVAATAPISKTKVKELFYRAMARQTMRYRYEGEMFDCSAALSGLTPGTILSENSEILTNSIMWKLSNGATVIFKQGQSSPGRFAFGAFAKGGSSLMRNPNHAERRYIDDVAQLCKIGNYTAAQVENFLDEQSIKLKREITLNTSSLGGEAFSCDLKTMMKMISLNFSSLNADTSAFKRYINIKKEEALCNNSIPEYVFSKALNSMLYNNSPIVEEADSFDEMNVGSLFQFVKETFSNAANYTFIFSGDIDKDLLKDYVCKYIASLPGNPSKKESWVQLPHYLVKYDDTETIDMKMEMKRSFYNLTLVGAAPYNMDNYITLSIVSKLIENRIHNILMENGLFSETETEFINYPEEFFKLSFSFISKEYSDSYLDLVKSILQDLQENGASTREIVIAKSLYKDKWIERQKNDTRFWIEILANRYIYGKDFYSRHITFLDTLTIDTLNAELKEYISRAIINSLALEGK